jgi:hypothetical protein
VPSIPIKILPSPNSRSLRLFSIPQFRFSIWALIFGVASQPHFPYCTSCRSEQTNIHAQPPPHTASLREPVSCRPGVGLDQVGRLRSGQQGASVLLPFLPEHTYSRLWSTGTLQYRISIYSKRERRKSLGIHAHPLTALFPSPREKKENSMPERQSASFNELNLALFTVYMRVYVRLLSPPYCTVCMHACMRRPVQSQYRLHGICSAHICCSTYDTFCCR